VESEAECTTEIDAAQAIVTLELAPAAAAWEPLLLYETLVDGLPWAASRDAGVTIAPGESWEGRGADRLYAACPPGGGGYPGIAYGLEPGTHSVQMRAQILGTDRWIESDTIEIDLRCSCRSDVECGGAVCRDGGCESCRTDSECGTTAGWQLFCVAGRCERGCEPTSRACSDPVCYEGEPCPFPDPVPDPGAGSGTAGGGCAVGSPASLGGALLPLSMASLALLVLSRRRK
jgi:hypothetical protein